MKITRGRLGSIIREELVRLYEAQDVDTSSLVDQAISAVESDIRRRAPTDADGIWRFDKILDGILKTVPRDKAFWLAIERDARRKSGGDRSGGWTGGGIVASYAQTKGAYATPGFAADRRDYME